MRLQFSFNNDKNEQEGSFMVKILCKNVQESPEQIAIVSTCTCAEDNNLCSEDIMADLHNLKQLFED